MKADISGLYLIAGARSENLDDSPGSGTRPEGAAPYLYNDKFFFINHLVCVGPHIWSM